MLRLSEFEYLVIGLSGSPAEQTATLAQYAANGWDLVCTSDRFYTAYLRRLRA